MIDKTKSTAIFTCILLVACGGGNNAAVNDAAPMPGSDAAPPAGSTTLTLAIGDETYGFASSSCQMVDGNIYAESREGMSGIVFQHDSRQTRVSVQLESRESDAIFQEEWEVRSPPYSVSGETITVEGTILRAGVYRLEGDSIRERMQNVERREEPFSLTIECRG